MKKCLLIISVFFIVLSCKDPVKKESPLTFDKLQIDKKIYASNDSTKPYMNLHMSFTYPITSVNDTILHDMQKVFVLAFAGEDYEGRSPKGAFDGFEADFTDNALELASMIGTDLSLFSECYQKLTTEVIDTTHNVISVKTVNDNYMGGAHGSYTIYYYLIDKHTAKQLKEKEIFSNYSEEKLSELILQSLTEKYGDDLKSMVFEVNEIRPNSNFFFSDKGITYVYNEYEIGPYSSGMIEAVIPYDKVNDLLSKEYKAKAE